MSQDVPTPVQLLTRWIGASARPGGAEWLAARCAEVGEGARERPLFLAFAAAGRRVGDEPLALTEEDLAAAQAARPGWKPGAWTTAQAARAALLLNVPVSSSESYVATLDKLFAAADVAELVALYQALPLLPAQPAHAARCAEGIRTNMTSVFTAVVHDNPYPAEHLDEGAWNQLVLKALFVGVPLHPILGLDERANPDLTRMLCDYAHERWAAGRAVRPDLWRCVGPHADDRALEDLRRVLAGDDEAGRIAAVLALRSCPHPGAAAALEDHAVDLPEDLDWADPRLGSLA